MRHIGFTGTRHGTTDKQGRALAALVESNFRRWRDLSQWRDVPFDSPEYGRSCTQGGCYVAAHHGDCIGADAEFHVLAGLSFMWTIGHLPEDDSHRAFCTFNETRPPLPHMKRNKAIVAESDIMIACPFDAEEKVVGGTWKTIGFTRKAGKPLAIVWPDGTVTYERWSA